MARTARGLSTADRYSYATHCSACRDLKIYPDEATSPAAFFKEDLSDAFQKLTTFVGGLPEYFHLAIDSCGIMQDRLQILRQLWSHTAGVVLFLLDNDAKIARFYDRHELDHPAKPGSGGKRFMEPVFGLPQNLALDRDVTRYVVILRGDGNSVTHHELLTWLPKMGRPLLNDTPYQAIHEDTITTLQIKLLKRRLNCEGSNE